MHRRRRRRADRGAVNHTPEPGPRSRTDARKRERRCRPQLGGPSTSIVTATPTIASVTNRGKRVKPGGPAAYVTAGTWPDGTIDSDAPHAIQWASEISRRLKAALSDTSTTAVAAEIGVARSTLYDIIRGTTWPDFVTIADLEVVLDIELLPRSSRHGSRQ